MLEIVPTLQDIALPPSSCRNASWRSEAIYIARVDQRAILIVTIRASLGSGRQRALVLLFIPSIERNGTTAVDHNRWSEDAMKMLGTVFGGATSFPRARGVWRDDERDRALVFDEPVMVWSLVAPESLNDEKTLD